MSTETFLDGEIVLKPDVGVRAAHNLIKELSDYTEVYDYIKGVMTYDQFLNRIYKRGNIPNGRCIVYSASYGGPHLVIYYHDVSWSSHIYDDKWSELEDVLEDKMNIIDELSLSLYYLDEADSDIHLTAGD